MPEEERALTVEQAQRAVGLGWRELVAAACLTVSEAEFGRVVEVRETFGGLHLTVAGAVDPEQVRERLQGIRQESLRTCEACGADGRLRIPECGEGLGPETEASLGPNDPCRWKTYCDRCAHRYYVEGVTDLIEQAWLARQGTDDRYGRALGDLGDVVAFDSADALFDDLGYDMGRKEDGAGRLPGAPSAGQDVCEELTASTHPSSREDALPVAPLRGVPLGFVRAW